MIASQLVEKLLQQVYRFLSYRPRSSYEIREYLKKKIKQAALEEKDIVDKIVQQLQKEGLIDDKAFVSWWLQQRQQFRPKSRRLIKLELKRLGIDNELFEEVFNEEESEFETDEEMAGKLLRKWMNKQSSLSKKELKAKYIPYLVRRGFNWEDIRKAIDKVINEEII